MPPLFLVFLLPLTMKRFCKGLRKNPTCSTRLTFRRRENKTACYINVWLDFLSNNSINCRSAEYRVVALECILQIYIRTSPLSYPLPCFLLPSFLSPSSYPPTDLPSSFLSPPSLISCRARDNVPVSGCPE